MKFWMDGNCRLGVKVSVGRENRRMEEAGIGFGEKGFWVSCGWMLIGWGCYGEFERLDLGDGEERIWLGCKRILGRTFILR